MPYDIKHNEVRLTNYGSPQEPHLYAITSGQKNYASLLFHVKIEDEFHTLSINKVNKKSCNMECVDRECPAKHKFAVDEKFVQMELGGLQNGDKKRTKFFLDFANPELRDISNWTVKQHDSKPHGDSEGNHKQSDFYNHIRRELRETHTSLALDTLQSEVDSTLRSWNLRRYGPQLEAMVVRNKINEHRSAWYKINAKIGYNGVGEIPNCAKYVSITNFVDFYDPYKEDHFQCSTENQHIFFLKSELYKFEVHDLFLDGTFHLVKNLSEYCQIYIISILYSENNCTFNKINYLEKYYFKISATFPNSYWSYYSDINDFGKFNMSTNSAEVINRELKNLVGNGKISFANACRKLKTFKENYLAHLHFKVNHDNLNPRRPKVIHREETLFDLVRQFGDLCPWEQNTEANVINFAFKFAMLKPCAEVLSSAEFDGNIDSDIGLDQTVPNFDDTVHYTQL